MSRVQYCKKCLAELFVNSILARRVNIAPTATTTRVYKRRQQHNDTDK